MGSALIGYTGFVGSNLLAAGEYDHLYNSSNVEEMRGREFEEVVCAGVPAVKWYANKHPEEDAASIDAIIDVLSTVKAQRFVLVSTIDVYADPTIRVNELYEPMPTEHTNAYGLNRLRLEQHVRSSKNFEEHFVFRLPALFGPGMKKNVLFDLLNDRDNEEGVVVDQTSSFQWYPVKRLHEHIDEFVACKYGEVINLFPEPIATTDILDAFFPHKIIERASDPVRYNLYTSYWHDTPNYTFSKTQVLGDMAEFIVEYRRSRRV